MAAQTHRRMSALGGKADKSGHVDAVSYFRFWEEPISNNHYILRGHRPELFEKGLAWRTNITSLNL